MKDDVQGTGVFRSFELHRDTDDAADAAAGQGNEVADGNAKGGQDAEAAASVASEANRNGDAAASTTDTEKFQAYVEQKTKDRESKQ